MYKINYLTTKGNLPLVVMITSPNLAFAMDKMHGEIQKQSSIDFDLCEVVVSDWDAYLTPWPKTGILKGRDFGGQARKLLLALEEEIADSFTKQLAGHGKIYLAGYSLAGLFSLWAMANSHIFDGGICCSPSLWYPGWEDYMEEMKFSHPVDIYLSLGDKEPKSRHPLLKQVGRITMEQYERLQQMALVQRVYFSWEEGGHFTDVENRMKRGICWMLGEN